MPSPDNLRVLSGNVFAVAEGSGDVQIGFPGIAGLGTIVANAMKAGNFPKAQSQANALLGLDGSSSTAKGAIAEINNVTEAERLLNAGSGSLERKI